MKRVGAAGKRGGTRGGEGWDTRRIQGEWREADAGEMHEAVTRAGGLTSAEAPAYHDVTP